MNITKRVLIALTVLALAGCALHTKPVHLQLPAADLISGDLKPIVIDAVTDARDFASTPNSTGPRIDPGIATQLGESGRASAISGATHGGYVMVIAGNVTVADDMRELVTNVLQSRGYKVVPANLAPPSSTHMSIKITEFWAYMPFNFGRALTWTQQLKAWIETDISMKSSGIDREFAVSGYGANIIQVYSEENVRETYLTAMTDYSKNLETKLFSSL